MSTQSDLLAEILEFLPERKIKETTFGLMAVNDGKFVDRLREGANMTLATIDKARAFMAAERRRLEAERARDDSAEAA
jgi:hypothetical protein